MADGGTDTGKNWCHLTLRLHRDFAAMEANIARHIHSLFCPCVTIVLICITKASDFILDQRGLVSCAAPKRALRARKGESGVKYPLRSDLAVWEGRRKGFLKAAVAVVAAHRPLILMLCRVSNGPSDMPTFNLTI